MGGTMRMEAFARLAPSLDLVHRVIDTAAAYTIARLRILEAFPAIRSASPFGEPITWWG